MKANKVEDVLKENPKKIFKLGHPSKGGSLSDRSNPLDGQMELSSRFGGAFTSP